MFNESFKHGKKFDFDGKDLPFITLDQYINDKGNTVINVKSVFIFEGKYGDRGVIVSPDCKITVPSHVIKDINKILSDDRYVAAINAGQCGFKTKQYVDKNGKVRNTGEFIDI